MRDDPFNANVVGFEKRLGQFFGKVGGDVGEEVGHGDVKIRACFCSTVHERRSSQFKLP